jgi:hypothetical protein
VFVEAGDRHSVLPRQGGPISAANLRALHKIVERGTAAGMNALDGFYRPGRENKHQGGSTSWHVTTR